MIAVYFDAGHGDTVAFGADDDLSWFQFFRIDKHGTFFLFRRARCAAHEHHYRLAYLTLQELSHAVFLHHVAPRLDPIHWSVFDQGYTELLNQLGHVGADSALVVAGVVGV